MGRFRIDVDKVEGITIVRARGKLSLEQLTQRFNELLEAVAERFDAQLPVIDVIDIEEFRRSGRASTWNFGARLAFQIGFHF